MAERTSLITLGLCQIKVGTAAPNGTMPSELNKIGKTYKNTCKIAQATADVTEHFEEGMAAPEVRKKSRKIPTLTFSIMDANVQDLIMSAVQMWAIRPTPSGVMMAMKLSQTRQFSLNLNRGWTLRFPTVTLKRS